MGRKEVGEAHRTDLAAVVFADKGVECLFGRLPHRGKHGVYVSGAAVPAGAKLGAAGAAQNVVAEKVHLRGRCFSILLTRVRATRRTRQVVANPYVDYGSTQQGNQPLSILAA